jgi:hypothetical protein
MSLRIKNDFFQKATCFNKLESPDGLNVCNPRHSDFIGMSGVTNKRIAIFGVYLCFDQFLWSAKIMTKKLSCTKKNHI